MQITIDLPDDLEQQLTVQANALDQSLETTVLQTLKAVARLIQALQSADASIRHDAAEALGELRTEAAVPVLFQMLHDQNSDVRQSAAEALRKIGTEAAIVALAQASTTESTDTEEFDPITPLIGSLETGTHDLAENHDFYIGQALLRELRPTE
ncbi:hypothetical protein C7B61_08105 [filamentous cyanobacterium CCP1]|nr:hypothetical protein C7B76_02135 [filamentous cyanobacterium CCP2]PSB67065.1 hypothetical protein C7B61_08105 [filamentous cyanobacterium CCP1]